ncbi:MAG: thioredoxin domain-containing protein [Anaerolineaceae bacterium]|nr:thioredoxin domain-containing protein [Anaerolineaceae bacterium]
MSNALAREISPYLLQHAENPVDWYPWSQSALQKAHREDKPIFLSIGYAACHWCHVMAHESFEDPEIAHLLNQGFVSIKVDREERPDLDALYMAAVVAMTGQGGWPMSLFLTPDGLPFYGGTYFPPKPRYGMPSFRQVLESVIQSWKKERENVYQIGQQVAENLQQATRWDLRPASLQPSFLDQAAHYLVEIYDWENGGWGHAPKFPHPMVLEFLLMRTVRGDSKALEVVRHALDLMSKGGMYDQVGGGFHRYSTDEHWFVPHFEKMLYDNAQLARVYLHAYQITGEVNYRRICEDTLDFIAREMTSSEGGFYSSLDADSEGEEGKYYTWTPLDIQKAVDKPSDRELLIAAYGITESGNFEGRSILRQTLNESMLAQRFQISPDQITEKLTGLLKILRKYREQRVRPITDDKVLVSWNTLTQITFREAGLAFHRADYLDVAMRNIEFILDRLYQDGRLYRSYRVGRVNHEAGLDDYAGLILALLSAYGADADVRWFTTASQFIQDMQSHFSDPTGGFFDTRDDQEQLLVRPKEMQDNATPSGNALACLALLKFAAYSGASGLRQDAEQLLGSLQEVALRYPTAFGYWLSVMDFAVGPVLQVAILGKQQDPLTRAMQNLVTSNYRPRMVIAISNDPPHQSAPELLQHRSLRNNQTTAYVCEGFVCRMPVNTVADLEEQLN